MKRITSAALIPLVLAASIGTTAMAGTEKAGMSDAQEATLALSSGMTLTEAVNLAQTTSGGTALAAEWDAEDQASGGYMVEIADASNAMQMWFVNPADGSVQHVIKARDRHDGDGHDGEGHDGDRHDDDHDED